MIFIQKVSILKFENLGKMLFPFLYPHQKKNRQIIIMIFQVKRFKLNLKPFLNKNEYRVLTHGRPESPKLRPKFRKIIY